ncbi:protoporphyrinogen oxidase [Thermobifida halotolerans]|uniref:Coproporphyrinogen III oxidase n=1 Tax=Thermobifida halotolerans TaxID=483545 RepID=A0AA97M155_9ACTN|nr:protoporphyrinogen oxidase [Thermobifida halotolerans]UOE21684.1 protoporphyrinogen oxidase [Thermobifida halotolerans]
METTPHTVVVGGGVSGLAAAHRLAQSGHRVTVLEAAPRPGGKLAAERVAGVPVDVGAEAVLARRPEALALIDELGLGDRIAHPGVVASRLYSRGRLRDFPDGHVMGVPGDIAALARSGILSPAGVLRAARDLVWPATPVRSDVPVATYIGIRMGREVVDRLVEPLLGGVYAGRADLLSLDATLPQIAPSARTERSLAAAVRASHPRTTAPSAEPPPPLFATLRGGLATLVDALAAQPGVTVETAAPVRELRRTERGWRLAVGPESRTRVVDADAVVVACPAPEAARLLRREAPRAAVELGGVDHADMAVVTLAYPLSAFPAPPTGSGFLVPAVERRTIKAVTFSSVKWPWLAEELRAVHPGTKTVLLRCSIGRFGDEAVLERDDGELVDLAAADLADICGVDGPPLDSHVTRWEAGLPQYSVGHRDRVARIRSALAEQEGIAVCGAVYDGVGVPACLGSAAEAARLISTTTARRRSHT